ncbi:uncharacterized protein TrAtP1_009486 [Trichoderma atroviride]|uniref:uncharacterized protein n=1 Tax=Hypocrea atroviridis TaxID=63577 RepID=UPI0033207B3D|nr:hypothetical protein TrAtP1_009486 [Trichoderma atroviride]
MASIPYKDITSSPPFNFVVGPDEKEHTIHSALVASQSAALNALIKGGMKESIERRVVWKDVDEEAFIRFSQYVYTGDYDGATPSKREAVGIASTQMTSTYPSNDSSKKARGFGVAGHVTLNRKRLLWDKFQALYPLLSPAAAPISEPSSHYDYTGVFLGHAQMYVFADYHGIEPLQVLALGKLRQILTSFTVRVESYNDITQLVRYTFEHTVDKKEQGDRLRSLVCLYAACRVEDLWKDAEFRDIASTSPDLSVQLITAMLDRLD